jgi:hypothetical protein
MFVSILIFILAVLIIAGSCATGSNSYKKEFKKDMVGTWVNPEYDKQLHFYVKIIIQPDLTGEGYVRNTSVWASDLTHTIIDRWIDNEGNIYYKVVRKGSTWKQYELWRLNSSKTIWEFIWNTRDYPTELNPESGYYLIYYRQ